MRRRQRATWLLVSLTAVLLGHPGKSPAEDWPMLGRDHTRNAVSLEKNSPTDWQIERRDPKAGAVNKARNIRWLAKLGTWSVSNPVVADGLVWVGTNNQSPRDSTIKGDASVLMCFRERDGQFLYQYVSPRLRGPGIGIDNDWTNHVMGSVPRIEGDRLWFLSNRCEAVCLDIGSLRRGTGQPTVLWKADLRQEFGVNPKVMVMAGGFSPSFAFLGMNRAYLVTGNGTVQGQPVPAPDAPSLICFNKATGKALWKDHSPGKDILDAQPSSALVVEVQSLPQVVVGQGDGWLRSFDARTGQLIWKCDLNPKDAKFRLGGRGTRNYVIATPVYYDGRVYIAPGQDPEHGEGVGYLYCIDPTGAGDVSVELEDQPGKGKPNPNSRVVWRYGGPTNEQDAKKLERDFYFGRTMCNCTLHDGLAYAVDLGGYLHCLAATTGMHHWTGDLKAAVRGTPLWVDAKVYVATEDGDVWIFAHGKEQKLIRKIEMDESIHAPPIFANGVLYLTTGRSLFAIQEKK